MYDMFKNDSKNVLEIAEKGENFKILISFNDSLIDFNYRSTRMSSANGASENVKFIRFICSNSIISGEYRKL